MLFCGMFQCSFCSATYLAVPRISQCHVSRSATYLAVPRISQCHVSRSATYLAVPRISQCHVSRSATYLAVPRISQCHVSRSASTANSSTLQLTIAAYNCSTVVFFQGARIQKKHRLRSTTGSEELAIQKQHRMQYRFLYLSTNCLISLL